MAASVRILIRGSRTAGITMDFLRSIAAHAGASPRLRVEKDRLRCRIAAVVSPPGRQAEDGPRMTG